MKSIIFSIVLVGFFAYTACYAADVSEDENKSWNNHIQATTVNQLHQPFKSPYSGPLSLAPTHELPGSFTSTLYVGRRLWTDAYFFVNPEESIGSGISSTHGIAAFPNGEVYRVDDAKPKTNLSRLFIQQDFGLGGEKEKIEGDLNQFAAEKDENRLTVVVGKFSLNDYLDDNTYSHDPRTQFLNWALMDTGAWDYAADTRGYTWGVFSELHLSKLSFRFALAQVPSVANGLEMDPDIAHAHAENIETEYRYNISAHPGKIRMLVYTNQAHMGNYSDSISRVAGTGKAPDITATRSYRTKYGAGLNFEQEVTSDLGVFSRLGWNDGKSETWVFTEIDRSFSLGASLKGKSWSRAADTLGLAILVDGLSRDHRNYLGAGGMGFIIGDGAIRYAPEQVVEAYYSYQILKTISLTTDVQYIKNPAFNADRGPVPVYAVRLHFEI